MGPLGELSPIDPLISGPHNPHLPENPAIKPPMNVEDIIGYINLAKDEKRFHLLNENNLLKIFEKLSDKIHPLALGASYRSHTLIRLLAEKLLQHGKRKSKKTKTDEIIKTLAEGLYYHNYLISRKEASALGLNVKYPDKKIEDLMWDLYSEYEKHMGLTMQFSPYDYFTPDVKDNSLDKEFPVGIIETINMTIEGELKFKFIKPPQPPSVPIPQIQLQKLGFKWKITRPKEEANAKHNGSA